MTESKVTLIKGDKVDSNTDYRDALPVNMYAVEKNILGASGYMLDYHGLTQVAIGSGIDRGGHYNERFETQFRVSGTKLIEVNSDKTVTELGTISGSDQAAMPCSFNTQCIIADGKMFLYDPTNGFREVTDSDLGNPIDGVWIDNYYFMTDGDYLFHTDIADESSIDPLKFATAEFSPDKSLGVSKTQDNKVAVWGRYSLEYFINIAADNFAFQRVETRAQKVGIVATHAKCDSKTGFFIVGGRESEAVAVHHIGLGSSDKISTREVDKLISIYSEPDLADMRIESRMQDDITFILVHLPDTTLCFNENIAKSLGKEFAWSILKSDIVGEKQYRAINGVFDSRFSQHIYGDKQNTYIGKLDNSVCTQYGIKVESILYTPFLDIESQSIDQIEIETIPGHNPSDDATVAVSVSVNGVTYGSEWWAMYGEPLDYGKRFIIRRLGYVRQWVGFKFRSVSTSRMAFGLFTVNHG
jgi:hypothetical protein